MFIPQKAEKTPAKVSKIRLDQLHPHPLSPFGKRIFAGECKYHTKPVDAPVYFTLKEKVDGAAEIRKAYPGYDVIFGVFSKSSFTERMLDTAKENTGLLLINEDHLV